MIDYTLFVNHTLYMATWEQIRDVRLQVNDPAGVISILSVSTLPDTGVYQTGYYLETDGLYYVYEDSEWSELELIISDDRISTVIGVVGEDLAPCRVLGLISRGLGTRVPLVRTTSGTESAEYQRIVDLYRYYRGLAEDCQEQHREDTGANTGRWGTTTTPEIAGGLL